MTSAPAPQSTSLLTPYAAEAVRMATDPVSGAIDRTRLLDALTQHADSTAARLLERLDRDPGHAGRIERCVGVALDRDEAEGLLRNAEDLRKSPLEVQSGTEHLLLALFAGHPELPGERPRRLREELERFQEEERRGTLPPRPAADETMRLREPPLVGGISLYLTLTAMVSILLGLAALILAGSLSGPWQAVGGIAWGLGFFLQTACLIGLDIDLYPRLDNRRHCWPRAMGVLFARSATLGAWLAFLVTASLGSGFEEGIGLCLLGALLTLPGAWIWRLARGLWGARTWFGILPRDGWLTLLREGRWMMLLVLMLDIGFPALLALAMRR